MIERTFTEWLTVTAVRSLPAIAALTFFCMAAQAQSDLPHFGIGLSASTLGIGIQGATAVTAHSNLRVGFNIFDYNHAFNKDGVNYQGELKLRSVQVTYDHSSASFT